MTAREAEERAAGPGESLRLLAVAFQFLTRLPVPRVRVGDDDVRRSSIFFPLVGVVVAGVGVLVRAGFEPLVGVAAATVVALAGMVAVTGAFHEDGLADTVDGVWGGWSPEQRLAIMRDSRIGTYGTVALLASLGLRYTLLVQLDLADFARAAVIGHVLGRGAGLLLVRYLPAAREEGHGARAAGPLGSVGSAVAATTVVVVLLVAAGPWAWVPLAAAIVAVAAMRRLLRRRLGGLTGDTLGATNQLAHIAAMTAVVALVRAGAL